MVKKIKKYVKFVLCCSLIMSLIAPSYAALSASDGSAFVTKSEFDAALADFNSRLTTFEAGINSKIDSQVTSYLDRNGIWNGKWQGIFQELSRNDSSGSFAGKHTCYYSNNIKPLKSGLAYIETQGWYNIAWSTIKAYWVDDEAKKEGWELLKNNKYWTDSSHSTLGEIGRATTMAFMSDMFYSSPLVAVTIGFAENGTLVNSSAWTGKLLGSSVVFAMIADTSSTLVTSYTAGQTYYFQTNAAYPTVTSGFVAKDVPIRVFVWAEYYCNSSTSPATTIWASNYRARYAVGSMTIY